MENPFDWDKLYELFSIRPGEKTNEKLKNNLKLFLSPEQRNIKELYVAGFYLKTSSLYWSFGDILDAGLPIPEWDTHGRKFDTKFAPALLISNTCDLNPSNKRTIPKQAIFAKLKSLGNLSRELQEMNVPENEIKDKISNMQQQLVTNAFYLPAFSEIAPYDEPHIAFLDQLFQYPAERLTLERIADARLASLNKIAFILLAFKLSVHFSRLPPQSELPSE